MKLIIDIPEEEYNHIKRTNEYSIAHTGYIYDGIPLEQIRAEIVDLDTHYDGDYFSSNRDAMYKCNEVLQIIDHYMKGE